MDALANAGRDFPSVKPSVTAAVHADTPTSYADINFTAMKKLQKSANWHFRNCWRVYAILKILCEYAEILLNKIFHPLYIIMMLQLTLDPVHFDICCRIISPC